MAVAQLHRHASVPALLTECVVTCGGATILRRKSRGLWKGMTGLELGASVREVGAALRAIGFGRGDVAALIAEATPEFAYVDLGIQGAGGASLGIDPEMTAEAIGGALRRLGCRVAFVENEEQLDKVLGVRAECPALVRVVIFDMKGLRDFSDAACESLESFRARGVAHDRADPQGWVRSIAAVAADDPCLVVISEDGCESRAITQGEALERIVAGRAFLGLRAGDERFAMLPMSQPVERILGFYLALDIGVISNFFESRDTLAKNLQELQPTVLGTDAATWIEMRERIESAVAKADRVQRALYRWAIAASERGGFAANLARRLVLLPVLRELGLARLRTAYIDATLPPEVLRWAKALAIDLRSVDDFPRPGTAAGTLDRLAFAQA